MTTTEPGAAPGLLPRADTPPCTHVDADGPCHSVITTRVSRGAGAPRCRIHSPEEQVSAESKRAQCRKGAAAVNAARKAPRASPPPTVVPPVLDAATARLEAHLARRCNPATTYHMRRKWARFVAFQRTCPDQPLFDQVQAWLTSLPGSQQVLGRVALKPALGTAALDWSALVVTPPRRNELRLSAGVLREEARAKVRAAARTPGEHALIELLWVLRRAEVAALRWDNLDLAQGMISVLKGKGAKPSWTLLPRSAPAALVAWFEASGAPPDSACVFTTPSGRPYTPNGIGRAVQRLLIRAGLWERGHGSAHRFRRSFATQYLKQHRSDLVGLMRLMRHNDIATTEKYVWLTPDDLAPRMAALEL